jgi:TRAP-type C4-dicarboxylate transport system permease small subunit
MMKEKLFAWLNWALMANLFFVLLCFAWFVVAVIGRSTGVALGLSLWYDLWTPVMQPAIGILMAGAILSGVTRWLAQRLDGFNQPNH